jgi:type I restriction enzyme S subunit
MKRREISDSLDHITEVALRRTGITIISAPAVLIVVRGMILARTFPCAVTTAPVTVNQDMKALLPKPGLTADYLVSLLTGIQGELLNLVGEAGHGTRCLRTDSWQNFVVPLPPSEEQIKIGLFLASETKAVNAEIIRAQREIDLIREYRTRLIADVVTGQLDVREAARDLPAEIEEPEAAIEPDSEDETEELLEAVDE